MVKRLALKWELAGIGFILVFGALLHFLFAWCNEWPPVAVVAAVNESVWEHLKLGFWPALFYSLIEYRWLRAVTNNFVVARTAALFLIPALIVALFYTYTAFIEDTLVADILIFVVAVVAGQLASYRLLVASPLPKGVRWLAIAVVVCLVLAFALLTFFAPDWPLFRDALTGQHGIPQ